MLFKNADAQPDDNQACRLRFSTEHKSTRDETYNYYYNEKELAQIKHRIDELAKAFDMLTVIANNHYRGAELANAIELKCLLTGEKHFVPEGLLRAYPNLAKVASNM